MAYDEKLAERIRGILADRPDIEERRMFGGIAFMVRGHMSVGLIGPTLMVRHEPADAEALLREPHARPMDFTGRPMLGFLYVDPPGTKTAVALGTWIRRATAWAETRPPKAPGKRPKGTLPKR
jgi:TfoX/Sxy family transcriptional regulator of competence genes